MPQFGRLVHRTDDYSLYECESQTLALVYHGRPALTRQNQVRVLDAELLDIRSHLIRQRRLFRRGSAVYLRAGPYPVEYDNAPAALGQLSKVLFFGWISDEVGLPPETLSIAENCARRAEEENLSLAEQWRFVARGHEIQPLEGPGQTPAAASSWHALCASDPDDPMPAFHGILAHPIVADEEFALDTGCIAPSAINFPPTPHLSRLFKEFYGRPSAHIWLYSYLFAVHHAVSLSDHSVPILVIDSWTQSRGKSLMSHALQFLVDNRIGGLSGDQADDEDLLVATMADEDSRCLVLDNVDSNGMRWKNATINNMSTTRLARVRPKYAKKTQTFYGLLPIVNFVSSQVSFNKDLVSRSWRIEVPGWKPKRFVRGPDPLTYAREYRAQIHSDIVRALKNRVPVEIPDDIEDRHRAFLRVGLGAYCAHFEVSPETAIAHLREDQGSKRGLLQDAKGFAVFHDTLKQRLGGVRVQPNVSAEEVDGAHLLGFRFDAAQKNWLYLRHTSGRI